MVRAGPTGPEPTHTEAGPTDCQSRSTTTSEGALSLSAARSEFDPTAQISPLSHRPKRPISAPTRTGSSLPAPAAHPASTRWSYHRISSSNWNPSLVQALPVHHPVRYPYTRFYPL
uniref:Uncharacterized protein n=1 Tax=Opuntia streptacantha TaxID=393608 RepID=A0A7C9EHP7_OPUST